MNYTLSLGSPSGDCAAAVTATVTLGVGNPGGTVTITPSDSGGGGAFSPTSVTVDNSSRSNTFNYTPANFGTTNVSTTNNLGLTDPSPVAYQAKIAVGQSGFTTTSNICPAMGGSNLWSSGPMMELYRNIANDPVDPYSVPTMNLFAAGKTVGLDFKKTPLTYNAIPYNIVPGTQPNVTITNQRVPSTGAFLGPAPIPPNPSIELWVNGTIPPTTAQVAVGDWHGLIIQRDETTGAASQLIECYKLASNDAGSTFLPNYTAQWPLPNGGLRAAGVQSSDAAGLPVQNLLINADEVTRGLIPHAIRFVTLVTYLYNKAIYPARATSSASLKYQPTLPVIGIPFGGRLRIKQSWWAANSGSFSGQGLVIATAMLNYGIILADITGGSGLEAPAQIALEGAVDDRWVTAEINQIKSIPMSALEMVKVLPYFTQSPTGTINIVLGDTITFNVARQTKNSGGGTWTDNNFTLNYFGSSQAGTFGSTPLSTASPSGTVSFTPPALGTYRASFIDGSTTDLPSPFLNINVLTTLATTMTTPQRRFSNKIQRGTHH